LLLDRELKPDPVIERKLAEAKERQKSPRVPQKVASSSQNQIHTSIQDQIPIDQQTYMEMQSPESYSSPPPEEKSQTVWVRGLGDNMDLAGRGRGRTKVVSPTMKTIGSASAAGRGRGKSTTPTQEFYPTPARAQSEPPQVEDLLKSFLAGDTSSQIMQNQYQQQSVTQTQYYQQAAPPQPQYQQSATQPNSLNKPFPPGYQFPPQAAAPQYSQPPAASPLASQSHLTQEQQNQKSQQLLLQFQQQQQAKQQQFHQLQQTKQTTPSPQTTPSLTSQFHLSSIPIESSQNHNQEEIFQDASSEPYEQDDNDQAGIYEEEMLEEDNYIFSDEEDEMEEGELQEEDPDAPMRSHSTSVIGKAQNGNLDPRISRYIAKLKESNSVPATFDKFQKFAQHNLNISNEADIVELWNAWNTSHGTYLSNNEIKSNQINKQ